jgi:flagellar FliL protein
VTEVNEVNITRGGKMAEGGGGGLGRIIKMAVVAVVVLVIVGAGVWATFFFLKLGGGEQAATGTASGEGAQSDYVKNPQFLELGTFIVNLADGRRYLKTTLQLLLDDEKAAAYLKVRQAVVKDLVISELQTLSSEQLRDPKERELLKQRLLRKIESLLPTKDREWSDPKPIKKVLITEFYLQ